MRIDVSLLTPKLLAERLRLLRELAGEAGRPLPADFPVCVYLNVNTGEDADRALESLLPLIR